MISPSPDTLFRRATVAEYRARLIAEAGTPLLARCVRRDEATAPNPPDGGTGPELGGLVVSAHHPRERQPSAVSPPPPLPFAGQIALVTGAAAGIGRACVHRLVEHGAAVVALDVQAKVAQQFDPDAVFGVVCDVTDEAAVNAALDAATERFGGLDMLVLNAGILPPSRPLAELSLTEWRRTLAVNLDANLLLLRETFPLLRVAAPPWGGRVVVVGSKSYRAPGCGVAAYSASKAALVQLARVAAMEWGPSGIRVNVLHPDAVFDTEIWGEDRLLQRAQSYNLTLADYKARNLLRAEITSRDVAELAVTMMGPAFAKTTGAQISIDGGNERTL